MKRSRLVSQARTRRLACYLAVGILRDVTENSRKVAHELFSGGRAAAASRQSREAGAGYEAGTKQIMIGSAAELDARRAAHQIAFLIVLGLSPIAAGAANAQQLCHVDAPQYRLQEDTVSWSMTIVNRHSCIRGVRFGNIQFDSLKLISPPQFGEVALQGPGFIYSPRASFHGQDAFSLTIVGTVGGKRGSSTIEVTVSAAPGTGTFSNDTRLGPSGAEAEASPSVPSTMSADATPPSVSLTAPSEGATVSDSQVALTATASDNVAVANVQFIVAGKYVGPAVLSPPYTTVWDSTTVADGSYTVYAVAQDTSGNYGTSSSHIIVKNK
jgi:hypothetical protein